MIRFPCICGHFFALEDDKAGSSLQCPECGRLIDVPALNDLAKLSSDGTYALGPSADAPRIAQRRSTTRGTGRDDSADTAIEDDYVLKPVEDEQKAAQPPPRYDPETGELIRPITVIPSTVAAAAAITHIGEIPKAKTVINYGNPLEKKVYPSPMREMFRTANIVVLGFVFLFHVFFVLSGFLLISGLPIGVVLPPLLAVILVAHLGNIIDETGPCEQDELPRLMRGLNSYEDFWMPFTRMLIAWILAYGLGIGLAIILTHMHYVAEVVLIPLILAGGLFAPALMLTAQTSGSWPNLSPSRVWGVIRACGARYVLVATLWTICFPMYLLSFLYAPILLMEWVTSTGPSQRKLTLAAICLGVTGITLFFMHYVCWVLGQFYREHHQAFPWVYQRHEKVERSPAEEERLQRIRAQREAQAKRYTREVRGIGPDSQR